MGEAEEVLVLKRSADQDVLERFTFDEFHDDIGTLGVDAVVENGDDVGMLEAGGGHGLAPGLLDEAAVVLGDLHPHALDGHRTVEVMVPGPINVAEAAAADELSNLEAFGDPGIRNRI
jgi:hypothetical protein